MQAVLALLQALVGAAVQLGLAYRAGSRAAKNQQTQTDQDTAANAIEAKTAAAAAADRSELLNQLQRTGRRRD